MTMVVAYLSLGSNMGDRLARLREAVDMIEESHSVRLKRLSSVYETEPIGNVEQADFYNIVIEIETKLSPKELLCLAHEVEISLKRKREVPWGPRTIDVDILLYDELTIDEDDLKVPHPEMLNRAFVLIPLVEIEPDAALPGDGPIRPYLDKVAGQRVKKIGSLNSGAV